MIYKIGKIYRITVCVVVKRDSTRAEGYERRSLPSMYTQICYVFSVICVVDTEREASRD